MCRAGITLPFLLFLIACGGGSGNNPRTTSSSAGPGSPPGQFVVVNTAANQTSTGVDITVPAPTAAPAPNAQFLGIGQGFAFSTGAQIHQGQTATVFLFGAGLSGNMQVKLSGPSDIAVSGIAAAKATDGTPGIQFTAAVAPNAGLGGRTVLLIDSQGDITTFTGGMEVVP